MKVKLEECYCGHDRFIVRATLPDGRRYPVPLEDGLTFPSRALSTKVLDLLESVEGVPRRKVRFI